MQKGERRFIRLGIITVFVVYLLILVGGIVRSTGSGMGCPDWPKCFGSWIPPSDVSELPTDYKEVYASKRAVKNEKFSNYLEFFGFAELADKIRNDESILVEADFNSNKTKIEYFNRLLGAVTGLLIVATFVSSLFYRKSNPKITVLSFLSLVLVIFQGWIGSVVVSTNLLPWMITVHMLLAFLLLGLIIHVVYIAIPSSGKPQYAKVKSLNLVLVLCLVTLLIQVVAGTQVREAIDEVAVAFNFSNKELWIGELGFGFYFHRSFSLLILGLHVLLLYMVYNNILRSNSSDGTRALSVVIAIAVVLEIITGVIMAYFAIPAFLQPLHLVLSSVMFGALYLLFLNTNARERKMNPFITRTEQNDKKVSVI